MVTTEERETVQCRDSRRIALIAKQNAISATAEGSHATVQIKLRIKTGKYTWNMEHNCGNDQISAQNTSQDTRTQQEHGMVRGHEGNRMAQHRMQQHKSWGI